MGWQIEVIIPSFMLGKRNYDYERRAKGYVLEEEIVFHVVTSERLISKSINLLYISEECDCISMYFNWNLYHYILKYF